MTTKSEQRRSINRRIMSIIFSILTLRVSSFSTSWSSSSASSSSVRQWARRQGRNPTLVIQRLATNGVEERKNGTNIPDVEISPMDHNTRPLTSLVAKDNQWDDRLVATLKKNEWIDPTTIQAHAIPLLLETSNDLMASSQTGSGKSLMFCLPMIDVLLKNGIKSPSSKSKPRENVAFPSAMIVSPTRELAIQTFEVVQTLCRGIPSLKATLATGGSDVKRQRQEILSASSSSDGTATSIMVGTPGRILQFADERNLSFRNLQYLVVDEADRLLDLGFEPQLTRMARLIKSQRRRQQQRQSAHQQPSKEDRQHQTVLCSATFPPGVQRIAADFLQPNYYFISVGKVGSTQQTIEQSFEWVDSWNGQSNRKANAIVRTAQQYLRSIPKSNDAKNSTNQQGSVIVFSNTKDDAETYGEVLKSKGLECRVIHGDKVQSTRNKALEVFKAGKVPILVATDVAARGLDVSSIGLVIQADAPRNVDSYTHRIGRTGRAGASGKAVTFLDSRNLGISSGLIDLLDDTRNSSGDDGIVNADIPSWLIGMAHVSRARKMEEENQLSSWSSPSQSASSSSASFTQASDLPLAEISDTNEQFTGQDFRRTAVEGSYGAGKDLSYRSFDDEAYGTTNDGEKTDPATKSPPLPDSADTISTQDAIVTNSTDMEEVTNSRQEAQHSSGVSNLFSRNKPSKELIEVMNKLTPGTDINFDEPNKKMLANLSQKPRLRFEYIGHFPFDKIFPLLQNTATRKDNFSKDANLPRVLMVAEKPSIAKAIADALSGKRGPRQGRGISRALPVYEFITSSFPPLNKDGSSSSCLITVTSVVGHIFSLSFDESEMGPKGPRDPFDYFRIPVIKEEEGTSNKLRVVDHLRALAAKSDHLVLWLDCDPEGENIAHEVIAVTRRVMGKRNGDDDEEQDVDDGDVDDDNNRIHRARFSAITPSALRDAFDKLEQPDAALSRSVDARQELDLRIGVALTRLLTWRCVTAARNRFDPKTRVVSYGPCQTPALSFCVDRARDIESFQPEDYWKVDIKLKDPHQRGKEHQLSWSVPEEDRVLDSRGSKRKSRKRGDDGNDNSEKDFIENATFNMKSAQDLQRLARTQHATVIVTDVNTIEERISPPYGLNTVALLEAGSKAMGMSPKQVMSVAEKLYGAGWISYPRTETTKYDPNGFDVQGILRDHAQHEFWGKSASYLLRTKYAKSNRPPIRGIDKGDHPPITPLRAATRQDVGGGPAWRVYEYIARHFIGSLHDELSFTRYVATLTLGGSNTNDSDGHHVNGEQQQEGQAEVVYTDSVNPPTFHLESVSVDSMGFADSFRWVLNDIGASREREDGLDELLRPGNRVQIAKAELRKEQTKPPKFLQEFELVRLMDENRIGTDASMAVHVSNIIDRGYVVLCDETGVPVRPPRPTPPGQKPRPRQIGRYLVPTTLGMSLMDLFGNTGRDQEDPTEEGLAEYHSTDAPAWSLTKPTIRRQMENEVKQIALGEMDKESCLESTLRWFEGRYQEVTDTLLTKERLSTFSRNLSPTHNHLRYWRKLNAFEEATAMVGSSSSARTAKNNDSRNKNTNVKGGRSKGRITGNKQTIVSAKKKSTKGGPVPKRKQQKQKQQGQ